MPNPVKSIELPVFPKMISVHINILNELTNLLPSILVRDMREEMGKATRYQRAKIRAVQPHAKRMPEDARSQKQQRIL